MAIRLKITVETEHQFVIRASRLTRGWCPHCGGDSSFASGDEIEVTGSGGDEALRSAHAAEVDGRTLVCIRSLTGVADKDQRRR